MNNVTINSLAETSKKQSAQPVQLHIMHSWGGGLQRWVKDYSRADKDRTNLILKSFGIPGIPGQRIALFQDINEQQPIRIWSLSSPIYATAITSLEYCKLLEEILVDFQVKTIIVSSLIGHSLDILNTGLITLFIGHDYYPFCPAVNIYFKNICTECQEKDLKLCFAENIHNRFFAKELVSNWLPIRKVFTELVIRNQISLVIPSPSIKTYLTTLEPKLKEANFYYISHGIDASEIKLTPTINSNSQNKLQILILGSLALHKGLQLFEEIYPELEDVAEFILLGCGDEGKVFNNKPNIKVIESYILEDLPNKIAEINPDLSLLLSIWPETFSYTLSELKLFGIPTLATKIGSFAEKIEDGKNGFLVIPEKSAIVEKIKYLSQQRHLIVEVAENLKTFSHKGLPEMINDYHDLIALQESSQLKLSKYLNFLLMAEAEFDRIKIQGEQIDKLQQKILAMESSKFWKIRKCWFKIKGLVGLPAEE